MHLKQLKLAGFKSFVDPTVVPFSSQLVAVVGPNGCGKSNIIDAVRWVMGESSAKTLRGESMADVIFKGSSSRKPVGQASVELVFDNTLGRLTGQYASYQEIAVKRLVTRDGESCYFLNGSRCRRRDITDIFLGTGAGARGYSIIGQDTISRLIEARPDDLRAYFEEAAGVSKYKERRRETMQRISQTRDNLARVADICSELDKQLVRLERQANAAERYTLLKQDERLCRAEIIALKWHGLTAEQEKIHQELRQLSLQYEQHKTNAAALFNDSTLTRGALQEANAQHQRIQTEFYQLAPAIARLEETIRQRERDQQRMAVDKQQLHADLQLAVNQLQQHRDALHPCEQNVQQLQSSLQSLRQVFIVQQQQVHDNQQQDARWTTQRQQVLALLNQTQREADAEHIRLQHTEHRGSQLQVNIEKIQHEQALSAVDALQLELISLQSSQAVFVEQHQHAMDNHQLAIKTGIERHQQLLSIEQQSRQMHDKVQSLTTEHAALFAAQQAALHQVNAVSPAMPQWENTPRLTDLMTVTDEWVRACELVLGDGLYALVLDSMDSLWPTLPALQGHSAIFVQEHHLEQSSSPYPRLSDKVVGAVPHWLNALEHVFAADNLADALSWQPTLASHQSVVTMDGFWLGQGWVRVASHARPDDVGLLARKQALAKLSVTLAAGQEELQALQVTRDSLRASFAENEAEQVRLKHLLADSTDELRSNESKTEHKQQALEHAFMRQGLLVQAFDDLLLEAEACAAEQVDLEQKCQSARQRCIQYEQQNEQLMAERSQWDTALDDAQRMLETTRASLHQTELALDRAALKVQQLNENSEREQRQIDVLHERIAALESRCLELNAPDLELHVLLDQKIQQHTQLETKLAEARQQVDEVQGRLDQEERRAKHEEDLASHLQEKRQQYTLQEQALAVRANSLNESLTELGANPSDLLAGMVADATVVMREQTLAAIEDKIKRLGAINLLAIEEYQTDLQRKAHLDAQYHDLTDALATLDIAIAKMDKETHQRLSDTFDQVNLSFQALFPRLFGGGRAKLELTCGNLLEAGILVMAQPPGKRNSTIHLLSGGEKAMTAVALVFAIFQLNPSPFCMLDEVDAPLDDANVRRFCDLVREMSPFVQFLFITHNKVTMELADHLIGVTMREPGVSRIVTVDVESVPVQPDVFQVE